MNAYHSCVESLAKIIKNYRKGELPKELDEAHVIRWIEQFSEDSREMNLAETLHIFSEWYFDINRIREFLREMYEYVTNLYLYSSEIVFLNCQQEGKSQAILLDELHNIQPMHKDNKACHQGKHLIYVDDGLYSGRHIVKDLKNLLSLNKYRHTISLDVFVMIGYSEGIHYVKAELEPLCCEKNIAFTLNTWKCLSNTKTIQYFDDGEEYFLDQDTLWPLFPQMRERDDIKNRIEGITGKKLHYCYREYFRHYKSRVFSSEEARTILEKEFLKQGQSILTDDSIGKGLYPLGFSAYPSLGFGSFCATAMNISNTCPVVLWWGNIQKHGNALDKWYPLLPRRTNGYQE